MEILIWILFLVAVRMCCLHRREPLRVCIVGLSMRHEERHTERLEEEETEDKKKDEKENGSKM